MQIETLKYYIQSANINFFVAAQVQAMGAEERAIPILEHVLKNHRVTNGDVQKMLDVSRATATRLLQKLEDLLEQVGLGAGSYYRIRNY